MYSARAYVLMLMSLMFSLAYTYACAYALVRTGLKKATFNWKKAKHTNAPAPSFPWLLLEDRI